MVAINLLLVFFASSVPTNLSYPTGCPPNPTTCCDTCPWNGIVFVVQHWTWIVGGIAGAIIIVIVGSLFGGKKYGK